MNRPSPTTGTRPRGATRNDVARLAGVSNAVVSYVINDGPRPVAEPTRLRVLRAIDELGYRPNAAARALKLARTRTIGLLVRDNANPFFAEFARAVEDAAFARNHAVLLGNSSGAPSRELAYIETFLDRAVDGLMIIGLSDAPPLDAVVERGTPLVVLDRASVRPGMATVLVDDSGGARTGTKHLIGHGHSRVACVAGPQHIPAAQERVVGWRAAMRGAKLPHPRNFVSIGEFSREGGYLAMRQLLDTDARPTATFVSSDIQAIGVLKAIRDAGLRIPDDVAVVSFDGTEESGYTDPPLTVLRQPFTEMAVRALDLLLGGDCAGEHTLPVNLVTRASCGHHPG